MKTYCPRCQTVFRITAEQLRVRAGRVRCGQCSHRFNALDRLLDDSESIVIPAPIAVGEPPPPERSTAPTALEVPPVVGVPAADATAPVAVPRFLVADAGGEDPFAGAATSQISASDPLPAVEPLVPAPEHSGTRRFASSVLPPDGKVDKLFAAAASLLALLLLAQAIYHFRGPIAIAAPVLRPALTGLSELIATELPLPRNADLISIEASDLQSEPGRNRGLVLQATLRNSARYGQAYPALELTLTDTKDKALVRRVLLPEDYLPATRLAEGAFPANGELDVRVWLEPREVHAAGYRLYAFYP